jgi:hypothetical protein
MIYSTIILNLFIFYILVNKYHLKNNIRNSFYLIFLNLISFTKEKNLYFLSLELR